MQLNISLFQLQLICNIFYPNDQTNIIGSNITHQWSHHTDKKILKVEYKKALLKSPDFMLKKVMGLIALQINK